MENAQNQLCLPIEIAKSLYSKWDAEVALIEDPNLIYSKALDGLSMLELRNGNTYEGEMSRGLLHGKGTFKWKSGVIYEGQFRNNLIEGKGKYTWPDGSTYTGDVHNGRKHGHGEFVSKAENAVYTGEWQNGHRNGKGKIEFGNGSVFEGAFVNGIKQGFGKMTYPSGNYYEGMWVNDIKEGLGTMIWVTTNEKYVGNWHNNKQNGQGTQLWLENRAEFKMFRNRYDGNWVDGRREGYGTFFFSTGAKYEGYWHNNMKEGFGMQTEENGQVKMGYYKADRPLKRDGNEVPTKLSATLAMGTHPQQSVGILPPIRQLEATNKDPKTLGQLKDLKKIGKKPSNSKLQTKRVEQASLRASTHHPANHILQASLIPPIQSSILRNTDAEENPYWKYLDIQNFEVSESVLNFLLRSHSTLKHIYKQYSSTKEYFSGMSLECAWKMLRDLKLIDQRCSPAIIDREFARGHKSWFAVTCQPEERLLLIQKLAKHPTDEQLAKLELIHHSSQLSEQPFQLEMFTEDTVKLAVENEPFHENAILRGETHNIHDGSCVLLFRHFVCLLLRIAKAKYCYNSTSDADLKAALEKLITRLSQQCDSKELANESALRNTLRVTNSDIVSFKSNLAVGKQVLEWARSMNEKLFDKLTRQQRSTVGTIDRTVPFKVIFKLLERANFLKEPYEKMMFLEKVERFMDVRGTFFKKECKSQAASIIAQLERSPLFQPLLDAEITLWEFHELIYAAVTKKMAISNCQDEIKGKYGEAIQLLIECYATAEKETFLRGKPIPLRKVVTEKDRLKNALLERLQQERLEMVRQQQLRLEAQRAELERFNMQSNDFNVHTEPQLEDSDDQM